MNKPSNSAIILRVIKVLVKIILAIAFCLVSIHAHVPSAVKN